MLGEEQDYRAITYRRHGAKCQAGSHRTWGALKRCLWPRAIWVSGEGPWASVAYCPRGLTVMLFDTEQEAREALKWCDLYGCGGRCVQDHALVHLSPDLLSTIAQ